VLNRLNALRYQTDDIPEGTWKIGIKAVDSLDQMSANVNEITIEVTTDTNAFRLASKDLTINQSETDWDQDFIAITDDKGRILGWRERYFTHGDTSFADVFSQALSSYGQPLAYYFDNASSSAFVTAERDYGKDYSGNFIVNKKVEFIRGTGVVEHLLRKEGETNPTGYDHDSVKTKARYQSLQVTTDGRGNVAMIELPVKSQLNVIPRTEYSDTPVTSNASGPTTITLSGKYSTAIDINISILGQDSADWTFDNLNLNAGSFDIYIFDKDGAQVSRQFKWRFLGV
jgi:hypothetical protein